MRLAPLTLVLVAMLAAATAATGCRVRRVAHPYVGAPGVVTLTNLHPSTRRQVLYSTNYQQDGLLPVCTPVLIEVISVKKMIFTVPQTGQQYRYVFEPDRLGEPIETHIDRYFGTDCERAAIERMSEIDQRGIQDGQVYQGMSREGTVIALGYPPLGINDLASDIWKYWRTRFESFEVIFVNGVVEYVRN